MVQAAEQAEREKQAALQQAAAEHAQAMESVRAALQAQVDENRRLYLKESALRKRVHNELMDLKGNIRVYCRVRPVLNHEVKSGQGNVVVEFPEEGEVCLRQSLIARDQEDLFEFDQVFNPESTQEQVFQQVEPLTQSALDGHSVCIFAYGQTGSGKTYTMDGSAQDPGVTHRTFEALFEGVGERTRAGLARYSLSISVLEIYNEDIRDLLLDSSATLSVGSKAKKLEVRQGEHGLHVPGLTQTAVSSLAEVKELMSKGVKNRTVGAHNVNLHSSRSHLVVTIFVETERKKNGKMVTTRSKLNLIDLAGSERLDKTNASGSMLQEAKSINKSLSALGNVIKALGKPPPAPAAAGSGASSSTPAAAHVPFRDSKLTYLLQDSLSGTSKVLMFVNISPVEWNAPESLCSLTFAQRCAKVQLGRCACGRPTKQK
jgi:kinesin family protein C2/C3